MARVLTADLGNSRLKLRLFRLVEGARAVFERGIDLARGPAFPAFEDEARAWLLELGTLERAALSSVAGEDDAARVAVLLDLVSGGALALGPDPGLEVRCREPAAVGRDRLYAARAALAHAEGPALVLDCGTALTVDAAVPPGVFLGGAIAAGPALLARALGAGAARLFEVEPEPGTPALGRDTREALAAGIVHGLRGAAAHLAAEVAREAGIPEARLVVTGGARRFLLEPTPAVPRPLVVPHLVHHGLLLALGYEPPREAA
jgi:pantothenate kinase type III